MTPEERKENRLKEIHQHIKSKGFTVESIDELIQNKVKINNTTWLLVYGLTVLVFLMYLYAH